jgi:hypothetical protein
VSNAKNNSSNDDVLLLPVELLSLVEALAEAASYAF